MPQKDRAFYWGICRICLPRNFSRSCENLSMIYGKSHDAILIKKIALHVWPLRQEVEQRIEEQLQQGQSKDAIIKSLQEAKFVAVNPATLAPAAEGPAPENAPAAAANPEESPADAAETKPEETPAAKTEEKAEATPSETAEAKPEEKGEASAAEKPEDQQEAAATPEAATDQGPQPSADPASAEAPAATAEASPTPEAATEEKSATPPAPERPRFYHGMMVLQEITMFDMCFFTETCFLEGQEILVEFQIPTKFKILGTVHYCRRFNFRSYIISQQELPYRAYITFNFAEDQDKEPLRDFLKHISTLNYKEKPVPMKAS